MRKAPCINADQSQMQEAPTKPQRGGQAYLLYPLPSKNSREEVNKRMEREELRKEAVKLIADADRTEMLLVLVALGAITESGGRALPDGCIEELKAEYTPEDFNKALEKTHVIKAIGQRDGDAVLCETCGEIEAFIRRYLIKLERR